MIRPPLALALTSILLLAATAPATVLHSEKLCDLPWHTDEPALAVAADGRLMIAWTSLDVGYNDVEWVHTVNLPPMHTPGDPVPNFRWTSLGQHPALCASDDGFTLACVEAGTTLVYQSNLVGYWEDEPSAVLTPEYPDFAFTSVDLSTGGGVMLTAGATRSSPTYSYEVYYASRSELAWSELELVAGDLIWDPQPQITQVAGPGDPLPQLVYLVDFDWWPGLVVHKGLLDGNWADPEPVPGTGGELPGPIGMEFDAVSQGVNGLALLGNQMQPPCPCNSMLYIERDESAVWQAPVDLTVDTPFPYDWPLSPRVAAGPDDRLHAFWVQHASDEDLEPQERCLQYWVLENGTWTDTSGDLADQTCRSLGWNVALALTPAGNPVLAWTRQDTVAGEPQNRAVWVARTDPTVSAPEARLLAPLHLAVSPNPFNPAVTLSFDLSAAGPARLTIHDLRGRFITTLINGPIPAGRHTRIWTGRDISGRNVPSGVYVSRLEVGGQVAHGRMALVR